MWCAMYETAEYEHTRYAMMPDQLRFILMKMTLFNNSQNLFL